VRLGEADGGGEEGLLARDGVSGAHLMLRRGWMRAAMPGTLAYIARRRSE
jgi:hypothetical protein